MSLLKFIENMNKGNASLPNKFNDLKNFGSHFNSEKDYNIINLLKEKNILLKFLGSDILDLKIFSVIEKDEILQNQNNSSSNFDFDIKIYVIETLLGNIYLPHYCKYDLKHPSKFKNLIEENFGKLKSFRESTNWIESSLKITINNYNVNLNENIKIKELSFPDILGIEIEKINKNI